ncbi:hypothetical protein BJY01DRAFT_88475 [Aspergillus pseudoustus]|uniref:Uncharacterized protein n=1 Tax=Aspergillus pseudoustus TaxID=1810923 RepID=A0ABR4J1X2_9EURO
MCYISIRKVFCAPRRVGVCRYTSFLFTSILFLAFCSLLSLSFHLPSRPYLTSCLSEFVWQRRESDGCIWCSPCCFSVLCLVKFSPCSASSFLSRFKILL